MYRVRMAPIKIMLRTVGTNLLIKKKKKKKKEVNKRKRNNNKIKMNLNNVWIRTKIKSIYTNKIKSAIWTKSN